MEVAAFLLRSVKLTGESTTSSSEIGWVPSRTFLMVDGVGYD